MTEGEKEQLIAEVRPVVVAFMGACEKADAVSALNFFRDNGKFMMINNGIGYDYKTFSEGITQQFESLESQKYTTKNEQFQVVGPDAVLYTLTGSDIDQLKNGTRILVDPLVATLLFERIGNEWGIVYLHESATVNVDSTNTKM
jgi:hypothetical protein